MKTFNNLIEDVQKPGLCHRCGGCVTFCTAINYGALELDSEGKPRYADEAKCIECGLCYSICPEIDELDEETKKRSVWTPPIGRVIETGIARATDPKVRKKATDGGVVTALLLHLFRNGRIDGAIVTKQSGPFLREPFLAVSEEDILNAAGFFFDTSHGMKSFSDYYLTYSQIREFDPLIKKGLQRVAFVGTPCQIKSVRRMQTLNIIPSDTIKFCLGLFCSGNFVFGKNQQEKIAQIGGFRFEDVKKINIKEDLIIQLNSGEVKTIMLDELEFMKRFACYFCPDYSAEYADVSFGGIGAEEGWTTVITRTPVGRAVIADARSRNTIENNRQDNYPKLQSQALKKVKAWSSKKKDAALKNRKTLRNKFPNVWQDA
ncbi:MAG: Coenzyme F420 hydrogenase/dehydrogenase, beta subunit C-terminal domain [Desulfobacterales bacterium]|nr:MAG: Coenzyme F420 hydrogenase/dehydrogenase, beta subunit C-terminal domain [Desulfobacterales bacterium]